MWRTVLPVKLQHNAGKIMFTRCYYLPLFDHDLFWKVKHVQDLQPCYKTPETDMYVSLGEMGGNLWYSVSLTCMCLWEKWEETCDTLSHWHVCVFGRNERKRRVILCLIDMYVSLGEMRGNLWYSVSLTCMCLWEKWEETCDTLSHWHVCVFGRNEMKLVILWQNWND